jgi:predicted AAA+ superfamily ATPase
MTSSRAANSILYMQDADKSRSYMDLADTQPSLLLKGDTPRLIDEWQMAPVLWDAVRFEVDQRQAVGQFILTGSSVPKDGVTAHTGTGRISQMLMRPMSLFESKESDGSVSLKSLFESNLEISSTSTLSIEDLAFAICRGGWPASVSLPKEYALDTSINYIEAIINEDISTVDGIDKNPERVRLLLRSLARNIATMATNTTIINDMQTNDLSMTPPTLDIYLNALRRIFVIEDQPAWSPAIRSRTAIRTSSKRHFVDPSIATAVLGTNPMGILKDFNTFGFLFESLCTRDLRIYSAAIGGNVFHYRDRYNLEADIIVSLRDGRWAAIEVKMGQKQIEEAAENLLKLKERINTDKMGEPSFLMVLTAGEFAYKRKDGVLIVPIGCLRD